MQFLISILGKTPWGSVGKGSILLTVLFSLLFLYNSYIDMQDEIQTLKTTNSLLQSKVTSLESGLELQIRNQQQADSMYLELKSVYAMLDKKLASNKATLNKLKSEKGTQNEKLLNTPLTPDIIDIANGVRKP